MSALNDQKQFHTAEPSVVRHPSNDDQLSNALNVSRLSNTQNGGQLSNPLIGGQLPNTVSGDQVPNIHQAGAQLQNCADAMASMSLNQSDSLMKIMDCGAVPVASPTASSRPKFALPSQNQQSARLASDRKRRRTAATLAGVLSGLILQGFSFNNIRAAPQARRNRRTSQAGAVNASTSQSSLMNVSSSSRQQPPFTHQVEIVLYSPKLQVIL